jgi:riboflavin kinase / FMN adenylyltransferase
VNFELDDVPQTMKEGIYVCTVTIDGKTHAGALHYGPRPVFDAGVACEVYLLDILLPSLPPAADVQIIAWLREVRNFESPEALARQIEHDVAETREAIGA